MSNITLYDIKDPYSIEEYSQKLINKTFNEVIKENTVFNYDISGKSIVKEGKGNLGQLIEEHFFGYECNSDSRPDFPEAGVELKVTPYKKNKNNSISAKERLIINMINYMNDHKVEFEESHLWNKLQLILLIYYLYDNEIDNKLDYKIKFAKLFRPSDTDLEIIKSDYNIIINKIKNGKAHEISGGDTLYLEAATKSSKSNVRTRQPFSDINAKPRAFALKGSYMTYILNNYIADKNKKIERIIDSKINQKFDDYIVNLVEKYENRTIEELCDKFDIRFIKKPKNLEAMIIYRILGIKGNKAEEFVKANIEVKTIRIEANNSIKESMSFPAFKFKELANETWEDSTFGNKLRDTKYLFVIYKYDKQNKLRLKGCQFWNIPFRDLQEVEKVWKRTHDLINDGLNIEKFNGKYKHNLPKQKENNVCHVRPHARDASDTNELPDGRHLPKQCFWLNSKYIYRQLNEEFKK
ncbi:MAG: type II restriction endonuclease [Fusobacteria bacterium]|nr:MAG: type II restriction endonuclease [Fusobacteriota bacterium]KAF0228505.1 MAG: type II restriction [Fusobacteriota bacterium]